MVAIPLLRWVLKTERDVMWPGCSQKMQRKFHVSGLYNINDSDTQK